MAEIDLLSSLPKTKRNIQKRSEGKSEAVIAEARKFGEMYWDGPREYGYGGYRYDGRWRSVARDIIGHFGLKPGMRVLDVGWGEGLPVQGPDARMPGPGGLRARHLALRALALRARGSRPAAIGLGGEAAVSRPRLRLRAVD